MTELPRLIDGELDDLLRARRKGDLAGRRRGVAPADDELDGLAHLGELDAQRIQDVRGHTFALAHQSEKKVLGADVVVIEADRLVLREREHPLWAGVEATE